MRFAKWMAVWTLFTGIGAAQAAGANEWKLGVGAQTSALGDEDYHMGVGGSGALAMERGLPGGAESRFGIRGNYLNFEPEENAVVNSFHQYGVGLEALIGPEARYFEPKAGAHVGYSALDGDGADRVDLFDVGTPIMATIKVSRSVDVQALVTPTWLIDEDDTDYETRGALNVQIALNTD